MLKTQITGAIFLLIVQYSAHSQTQNGALDAIIPQNEAISVGEAGDDPADIGRYLLASGASAAAISPDGMHIAMRYSVTGEPQLWVVPTAGGQMQQLTFGNGVTFFRWTPDSRWLLYGADNDGNEQESYALIRADGQQERIVLPPVSGGFRSFGDFSADGSTVYFASTERNGLDFDIYRADLTTGDSTLLYEGSYANYARSLSPDGRYLVVTETVG
ncbi:MAG: DPP IV N-terminal domain-containing protein, partial [Pseudomonadales bacterium]|nr:DPP IV N-terminal domain-containing protein [Pseudomonadales bacterium]